MDFPTITDNYIHGALAEGLHLGPCTDTCSMLVQKHGTFSE